MKTPIEELIVNLRTRYGNNNDLANEVILFASMALEEEKEAFLEHGRNVLETYRNMSIAPIIASEKIYQRKYE